MAQPIRKNIQENHSEMIKEPRIYTLLVDGGSLLMMSMLADEKVNSEGVHYGGVFQFLLQLYMQFKRKQFDYVYVFFDDEFSGYKRYELYPQYKANRDKKYHNYGESEYMKAFNAKVKSMQNYFFSKNRKKVDTDVEYVEEAPKSKDRQKVFLDENFDRERDTLCKYFEELCIRWYMDEVCEGDDLISYYCKNRKENEYIAIVTGDMDISQMLRDDHVCVYDLHKKKYITGKDYKTIYGFPCENILVKKVFCGDTSDNISNIAGLSETKLYEMMPEMRERPVTVSEVRERAQTLIDERVRAKKKPLKVHENIVNGVANKEYIGDFYEVNERIIDLTKPLMTDEATEVMDSMMHSPMDPEGRSFENLYAMVNEDGIDELRGSTKFASFFNQFKFLETKERKRYEESIKNS